MRNPFIPTKKNSPVTRTPQITTDTQLYVHTLFFGLLVFGIAYFYTWANHIPNVLNKAVADTSIVLIGCSMLLSSLCYFWNIFDTKIIYRKHLGLIGFAFGLVHIGLSWSAVQNLFKINTWQNQAFWPALTGLLAAVIFTLMTLVSNRFAARHLGGKLWRYILRTGYLAMILVLAHVMLLKASRWLTWYQQGMQTPPAMSLIVTIFMVVVLGMRMLLLLALRNKNKTISR